MPGLIRRVFRQYLKSKLFFSNNYESKISASSRTPGMLIKKGITGFTPSYLNSRPSLLFLRSNQGVVNSGTGYRRFLIASTLGVYGLKLQAIIAAVRFYYADRYPPVKILYLNVLYQKWMRKLAKTDFKTPLLRFAKNYKLLTFFTVATIVSGGVFGTVERVPYSNRVHIVLSSDWLERCLGDHTWKEEVKKYQELEKIYGEKDPETFRVQKILVRILDAMHNGLELDHGFLVCGFEPQQVLLGKLDEKVNGFDSVKKLRKNKWESRFGIKFGTKHLEGLNWELILVKVDDKNAFYIPNGKIVVFDKIAEGCTDTEIATVIGHEIGHGVARHGAESVVRFFCNVVLLIIYMFSNSESEGIRRLTRLIELFISRRRELEADYIGLMLMASAGYDPRAAPKFYKRLDNSEESLESTHPSGEKRAKKLNRKEVMERAVAIYEQARAGHCVKTFTNS